MNEENIKPVGEKLKWYLDHGYAICNKCGTLMRRTKDPLGGCDVFVCPACGWEVDEYDYEYDDGDPLKALKDDDIPEGCEACGGPYPDCVDSCPLFDD